jgi:hypothetical protein
MALSDVLPDRPLTSGEFEELQNSNNFEQVTTTETPGSSVETVIITKRGDEYMLHYTPENGWHKHQHEH